MPDESRTISSNHAKILIIGNSLVFADESTNGSKVNDSPVKGKQVPLPNDAVITIGPYKLKLAEISLPGIAAATVRADAVKSGGASVETKQYMGVDLVAVSGDKDKGKKFMITKYTATIGRSSDQDFVLEDETVSRQHAVVTYRDGKWEIQNVSTAKQGTTVNGQTITSSTPLKPGDKIGVGTTVIEFRTTSMNP